nr:hypothetical protein Q903MT_gene2501 [Picea sitchensis]
MLPHHMENMIKLIVVGPALLRRWLVLLFNISSASRDDISIQVGQDLSLLICSNWIWGDVSNPYFCKERVAVLRARTVLDPPLPVRRAQEGGGSKCVTCS